MASNISTKEKLLLIVDDMELICKELIENLIAPKQYKLSSADHQQLIEILVSKDKDFRSTLKVASDQAIVEQKIDNLKAEVDRQDQNIMGFQRQLKEAEQILATSLHQARQKLQSIAKANKKSVALEDLVKFSHRISASNAVCSPLSWNQGDLRRPYPTDIEMRLGFLGRPDLPINGHGVPHGQNAINDIHRQPADIPASSQNQFAWHPSGELHMSVGSGSGGIVTLDTRTIHKESPVDDVEVMSSESSSSSSSDSQ